MVAIETEHGRFEADSLRAARRLAVKAEKKARQKQEEWDAHYSTALDRARAAGFWFLTHTSEGKVTTGFIQAAGTVPFVEITSQTEHTCKVRFRTRHGEGDSTFNYCDITHVVYDACGNDVGVFYTEGRASVTFCTVGCCEGVIALQDVPGITPEMFGG